MSRLKGPVGVCFFLFTEDRWALHASYWVVVILTESQAFYCLIVVEAKPQKMIELEAVELLKGFLCAAIESCIILFSVTESEICKMILKSQSLFL